jgi:probable phosphoglycerate mutase
VIWRDECVSKNPGNTNQQTKSGTPVEVTERLKEWDYGDYEGLTIDEVHQLRKERGLEQGNRTWNIWVDGCEGGE